MVNYTEKLTRRAFLCVLSLIFGSVPAFAQEFVLFKKSNLEIRTSTGPKEFQVELAITDKQHSQGLMYRRTLAPRAGMLFDYGSLRRIRMWMKNTLIPLDMIFIGQGGKITHIVERTIPLSQVVIASKGLVRAVLEVNSGTASRLGIKIGDTVHHSIFRTSD